MDSYVYKEELWTAKDICDDMRYAEGKEKDRLEDLARSLANRLRKDYGADDKDVEYIIKRYL